MPKRKNVATATDERIRTLALRFASDISRMVRSGIAEEVTGQVQRVLQGISQGSTPPLRLGATTNRGDGRIGKPPVPVACQVSGCKNVGVRAKRNFCVDHATSLSEAEKARLREQQVTGGASEPRKVRGRKRGRPPKEKAKE